MMFGSLSLMGEPPTTTKHLACLTDDERVRGTSPRPATLGDDAPVATLNESGGQARASPAPRPGGADGTSTSRVERTDEVEHGVVCALPRPWRECTQRCVDVVAHVALC